MTATWPIGAAASNLTLSDVRAAAVKAALVADFGADAARITTKGLGDTKPAAPNTTAEGRAQNRRVEVVKLSDHNQRAPGGQARAMHRTTNAREAMKLVLCCGAPLLLLCAGWFNSGQSMSNSVPVTVSY